MKQVAGFLNKISEFKYGETYAQLESEHWASVVQGNVKYNNSYDNESEVYLFLGVNYFPEKGLNMFGGFNQDYYNTLKKFHDTDTTFYSLGYDIPEDFLDGLIKRAIKKTKSTYEEVTVEVCEAIKEKALKVKTVMPEDFIQETDSIMFGDSHSYSMSPDGVPCVRMGGRTLFGALKGDSFKEYSKTKASHMIFMFGSIDIRHHVFRQPDPYESMSNIIKDYLAECRAITELGKTVEICAPVPVEPETRKFSKYSGFKGTYFFGSREERLEMTLFFIEEIKKGIEGNDKLSFSSYPEEWYHEDPTIFETRLERLKGEHVSMNYCRRLNFGKEKDININVDEW